MKDYTFHLQYKHSGTFANHKYEELSYPKKSENVRPHYSQSSRENATPSSGTFPLASHKEIPPPPPPRLKSPSLKAKLTNTQLLKVAQLLTFVWWWGIGESHPPHHTIHYKRQ